MKIEKTAQVMFEVGKRAAIKKDKHAALWEWKKMPAYAKAGHLAMAKWHLRQLATKK